MPSRIGPNQATPTSRSERPAEESTTRTNSPDKNAARPRSVQGPLSDLRRPKRLPDDVHHLIAEQARGADLGNLALVSKRMYALYADEAKAFSDLKREATDSKHLLRQVGVAEPGRTTIPGWSPARQNELLEPAVIFIQGKLKALNDVPADKRAELLDDFLTAAANIQPEDVGATAAGLTTAYYRRLPPESKQAFFDKALDTAKGFQPGFRPQILVKLAQFVFESLDPNSPDAGSIAAARDNIANIANGSDDIASGQLKPILEKLSDPSKFSLLAIGQTNPLGPGDWKSPFDAVVEAGKKLKPDDMQGVHANLKRALDDIHEMLGNFGANEMAAARHALKDLEPADSGTASARAGDVSG
jgi:hypothetical protein